MISFGNDEGFSAQTKVTKDGPGLVMVSDTLCPAVHILGTQNVHSRAKGTADYHWPWAVFFEILEFRQGGGPKVDDVL